MIRHSKPRNYGKQIKKSKGIGSMYLDWLTKYLHVRNREQNVLFNGHTLQVIRFCVWFVIIVSTGPSVIQYYVNFIPNISSLFNKTNM